MKSLDKARILPDLHSFRFFRLAALHYVKWNRANYNIVIIARFRGAMGINPQTKLALLNSRYRSIANTRKNVAQLRAEVKLDPRIDCSVNKTNAHSAKL